MPSALNCLRPQDPHRRTSKDLDKKISSWMKQYKKSIKLLLLGKRTWTWTRSCDFVLFLFVRNVRNVLHIIGAGESGKTTIIKQMKILHVEGFSMAERQEKAFEIRRNILESIKVRFENDES